LERETFYREMIKSAFSQLFVSMLSDQDFPLLAG
jgi:hypothetical protein